MIKNLFTTRWSYGMLGCINFRVSNWKFKELKTKRTVKVALTNWSSLHRSQSRFLSFKSTKLCQPHRKSLCIVNMAAGQPDNPGKLSVTLGMDKARSMWDSSPQSVKSFPWKKTMENCTQLILDLILMVVKYLSIPLFAITSISEMSYCAHERKLFLIPLPVLIGFAVAGVLRDAALVSSPYLKNAEVPWHLISILIFFALLKFPGPYYPYWGRMIIPHLANGVILRTLWFMFLWYGKPRKIYETNLSESTVDSSEPNGV